MLSLLAAAAALAGPGQERQFGSWVVNCDNVGRCQASALSAASEDKAKQNDAQITREPGPTGGVTIEFWPGQTDLGVISILIDGRPMASGGIERERLRISGTSAEGLARAMAQGRTLTLRARGRTLAAYSLAGSSAMLRYIDSEQGRADGVTALVAMGPKAAAAVPMARALPRIVGVRPSKGRADTLDAAALQALAKAGNCDAQLPDHAKPGFHRLDARSTLVMVPCRAGARDTAHLAYVLRGGKAAPARFDWAPADASGAPLDAAGRPATIVNYAWDGGELATEPLPFYPGACGVARSWVWDGDRFRLTRDYRLGICSRWAMWLTAYRAEVAWR